MIDNSDIEHYHKLFEIVRHFVYEAGGDGDGWVISSNYRQLAQLFEQYENDSDAWFTERIETEHHITFSRGQESIRFCHPEFSLPEWSSDITVIL